MFSGEASSLIGLIVGLVACLAVVAIGLLIFFIKYGWLPVLSLNLLMWTLKMRYRYEVTRVTTSDNEFQILEL